MLRPRYLLFAGLVSVLFPEAGLTQENWNLCRIPSFNYIDTEDISGDETRVEAQTVTSDDGTTIHLVGDVSVNRADLSVSADDVIFNKSTAEIFANGNVDFATPNIHLQSSQIEIDSRNDRARFEQPEFELRARHAHGRADRAEQLDRYRSRFSDITYTSCDPENRVWYLRASELEIDDETGVGSATHATLYFQDVPFLYLPYFQFPIDDRRQSGLLSVKTGYSETSGRSYVAPVYWNIAPNYDMTIAPAYYSERGLQLNTENRYLFESHRGQLELSYLDDDERGDGRWFQQWQHNADIAYGIDADLLFADVSDRDFFYDFGGIASEYDDIKYLDRHLSFARDGETWQTEFFWQDYKTLDKDTETEDRP